MRVALTGTTSGIGLRAAAALCAAGHDVVALVRDPRRARDLVRDDRLDVVRVDLAEPATIADAAAAVAAAGPLDALVLNAAVFDQSLREPRVTSRGQELFWATNHLGPFELAARLSPALAAASSPHLVFVASKGVIAMPRIRIRFDELDDLTWFTPTRAYYHAKLAQVMTAMTLAESAGDRLAVSCLRVPAVRLDPARLAEQPPLLRLLYAPKNAAAATPERLAAAYADLVAEPRRRSLDEVYVDETLRVVPPPAFARDPEARRRLWAVSQAATGSPRLNGTTMPGAPPGGLIAAAMSPSHPVRSLLR